MIVDSHCHLNHRKFKEEGLTPADVIHASEEMGVTFFNSICCFENEFKEHLSLAEQFNNVVCTYGIHPHHADERENDVSIAHMVEQSRHEKVVAIGECGLDYFYEHAPKAAQEKLFRTQLEAAAEAQLPVVIHTREAERDTARILEGHLAEHPDTLLLFHCFSSNAWLADWGVEHGVTFGASGIVTFKKSVDLQSIFKRLPEDKILVETDAPYLAPPPHRGKLCSPGYTALTLRFLAELRKVSEESFAAQTTENFKRFFPKAAPFM